MSSRATSRVARNRLGARERAQAANGLTGFAACKRVVAEEDIPPADRPRNDLELAFGRKAGFFFLSLRGCELELLRELFPDVFVLAAKPARDAVASLVSTRGSNEKSDGCPQYGAHRDARRKQTDIVPIRYRFVR